MEMIELTNSRGVGSPDAQDDIFVDAKDAKTGRAGHCQDAGAQTKQKHLNTSLRAHPLHELGEGEGVSIGGQPFTATFDPKVPDDYRSESNPEVRAFLRGL